ncbi:hypothetical protein E2C01_078664 [Portunus trituberculatus]|uniref:Uncharacterized protein n=1 Tax=Portunus trituberculatus TaxID=210409 RepID=A0A5B7IJE6_PORTR|nr:hypothetical protein [Portunus trituberculatus]
MLDERKRPLSGTPRLSLAGVISPDKRGDEVPDSHPDAAHRPAQAICCALSLNTTAFRQLRKARLALSGVCLC